ncbi:TPA: DUF1642 domain-containing protein [Enterococcus faecium]
MNKQELLAKYYAKKDQLRPYCPNRNRKEEQLKSTIYTNIIDDLKQLDEPQKPVVPKVVANWFEDNKENLGYKLWQYIRKWDQQDATDELQLWFEEISNNAIEALIRMKDGYEVEKEPLYYVVFDILQEQKFLVKNIKTKLFYLSNNENVIGNYEQVSFTEQEIKAIDERYWSFAVPVEEG